jgi:dienelactone hydrolase
VAEVFLFHHAQGLTSGVTAFADALRGEGHTVHTPDLYDGHTFETLEEGLAYAERTGFDELLDRGVRTVTDAPAELVYVGFSLGVLPAQKLAQTRPGARGAVFVHSCVPGSAFGTWPTRLPVRIHAMEADRLFTDEGDAEAAHALVDEAADAELHLYPGDQHLFADSSLPSYDAGATALLLDRTLTFLRSRDAGTREGFDSATNAALKSL